MTCHPKRTSSAPRPKRGAGSSRSNAATQQSLKRRSHAACRLQPASSRGTVCRRAACYRSLRRRGTEVDGTERPPHSRNHLANWWAVPPVERLDLPEHAVDPGAGIRDAREPGEVATRAAVTAEREQVRQPQPLQHVIRDVPAGIPPLSYRPWGALAPHEEFARAVLPLQLDERGAAPPAR